MARPVWRVLQFILVVTLCAPTLARAQTQTPTQTYYTGWAIVAYPGDTQSQMETALRRMKDAGANVVWIGHNNPGEVDERKVEPGLSYAVYAAAQDSANSLYANARTMLDAQHRMLRAARAVGLPVVFPVGYQIQMGRAWNEKHPDDLRRYRTSEPLDIYGGGVSASPYSAQYRADIRAYYEWVRDEFVTPYRDVILMLNLADEPLGGDYSAPAEAEFRARYGVGFAEARPAQVGAFQDRVILDYAIWSAEQWQELAPGLPVTMSFCGAQGRWSYHLPDVEALFRDTPENFVVTFDAYLHDDLPFNPLIETEVGALVVFARTLGYYSARYRRDVWLWPAGNRWGLAGDSSNPGGVGDALANGYLLALAVRSTGGALRGLAVWNYNVRHQGLFGDPDPAPYDRERLFARVSAAFADWQTWMAEAAGQARVLALLSAKSAHTYLGLTGEAVRGSPLDFGQLLPLARADVPLAIVSALPHLSATSIETVIVLDSTPATLSARDRIQLQRFAARGGRVLATHAITAALWPNNATQAKPQGVAVLPANPARLAENDWARFWPDVATQGLRLSSSGRALFCQPGLDVVSLPANSHWRVFDIQGNLIEGAVQLGQHEFALTSYNP
jgi:hypothetical protein